MTHKILAALFAFGIVATAQPAMADVKVGRDVKITVTQKKAVTTTAIGPGARAHTTTGGVFGNVDVGRDVTISVSQEGAVTTTAIGPLAHATTTTGVVADKAPF